MCQSRRITPGRYKGARRQSKAVGSTEDDSGQLLEVIKAFEPESCSRPLSVSPLTPLQPGRRGVYFDLGPWRTEMSLFISAGEQQRQREPEKEWNSPDLLDLGPSVVATQLQAGSPWLTSNTWLGMQEKTDKCVGESLQPVMMTAVRVANPHLSPRASTISMFPY